MEQKLRRNTLIYDQYKDGTDEPLKNNCADEVSYDEDPDAKEVWYCPHHPSLDVSKPKPRTVFYCAAKLQGVSLNDCVSQGTDLMNRLVGVLLRFPQDRVAFMADIRIMF